MTPRSGFVQQDPKATAPAGFHAQRVVAMADDEVFESARACHLAQITHQEYQHRVHATADQLQTAVLGLHSTANAIRAAAHTFDNATAVVCQANLRLALQRSWNRTVSQCWAT
jgi:hypothetical protein